jgi:organic hydroperoxide reductase OsmC/OhrA
MHTFQVETVWRHDRESGVSARDNPDLTVTPPPEFGGAQGTWSPEQLLVASVGSCLLSTCLNIAHRFELSLDSYSSTSTGRMEKTSEGLRFTGLDVRISVTVPDDEAAAKASSLRLKEKLEKYCPVSASLNCPVRLLLEITRR